MRGINGLDAVIQRVGHLRRGAIVFRWGHWGVTFREKWRTASRLIAEC